jgi:hypothetical protein
MNSHRRFHSGESVAFRCPTLARRKPWILMLEGWLIIGRDKGMTMRYQTPVQQTQYQKDLEAVIFLPFRVKNYSDAVTKEARRVTSPPRV